MDMIVLAIVLISWLSAFALALVVYDMRARLKTQSELTDTLNKLRETHNSLAIQFQTLSDQVSRLEMSVGLSKPR
jgi:aromatic ring-opening dioxygenase LigB subunit